MVSNFFFNCPDHFVIFNYTSIIIIYCLDNNKVELPVIDVIDKACPQLIERCLSMLPSAEKSAAMTASASNSIDLQWIVDRNAPIWTAGKLKLNFQ